MLPVGWVSGFTSGAECKHLEYFACQLSAVHRHVQIVCCFPRPLAAAVAGPRPGGLNFCRGERGWVNTGSRQSLNWQPAAAAATGAPLQQGPPRTVLPPGTVEVYLTKYSI